MEEPAEEPVPKGPEPEITTDTEYSGEFLRSLREARGIELRDVAARTRIPMHHLKALEEEDYKVLPPAVYTRGFVIELAKTLRLDPESVARSYLRRLRKAVAA
ncbi:MAG: helix-turn-helix domain-containing protein [Deltaproteobacteria bacterium]|nr:helix-turn-helix domain-containing protein [Deltaproteobacteria bacterium]